MKRIIYVFVALFFLATICQGEGFNFFSKAQIGWEIRDNFSLRKVEGDRKISTSESSSYNPSYNSMNSNFIEHKELEQSVGLRFVFYPYLSFLNLYVEGGKSENTRTSFVDYYSYYYGSLNQESTNPGLYGLAGGEIIFFSEKKVKMKLGYERKETEYKKITASTSEYVSGKTESILERTSKEEKFLWQIESRSGIYLGAAYSRYSSKYISSQKNSYNDPYFSYYSYNNETKEVSEMSNKNKIGYFIGYATSLGEENFLLDTKLSFGDEVGIGVGLRLIL